MKALIYFFNEDDGTLTIYKGKVRDRLKQIHGKYAGTDTTVEEERMIRGIPYLDLEVIYDDTAIEHSIITIEADYTIIVTGGVHIYD